MTTWQHRHVIYQTKAKGVLYTSVPLCETIYPILNDLTTDIIISEIFQKRCYKRVCVIIHLKLLLLSVIQGILSASPDGIDLIIFDVTQSLPETF